MRTRREQRARLVDGIRESQAAVASLMPLVEGLEAAGRLVVRALRSGHKILTAGNGGSAAEALHMAEELVGRFRADRVSLPAVSLVADSTVLTCIGNDFGFDQVFSRQVEGLGKAGDVLVVFSTSGTAANLGHAVRRAAGLGVKTVCVLGRDGGPLAGVGDIEVVVPGRATERIQEAHQVIVHLILDMVEEAFAGSVRRGR